MRKAASWSGLVLPRWSPPFVPPGRARTKPRWPTHRHIYGKDPASRAALEGERKQVTVLFADIKDSTELIRTWTRKPRSSSLIPPFTA